MRFGMSIIGSRPVLYPKGLYEGRCHVGKRRLERSGRDRGTAAAEGIFCESHAPWLRPRTTRAQCEDSERRLRRQPMPRTRGSRRSRDRATTNRRTTSSPLARLSSPTVNMHLCSPARAARVHGCCPADDRAATSVYLLEMCHASTSHRVCSVSADRCCPGCHGMIFTSS